MCHFLGQTLVLHIPFYSEFKPVKLRLKIDLVSYPTRVEGLINMDTYSLSTSSLGYNALCMVISFLVL